MKLFFSYLRGRRRYLLMLALFCALFAVSFSLYHLPLDAVLYPTLVCSLLGAAFAVWDFLRVKKRHEALTGIKTMTAALIDSLPEPRGVEEEDYQEILRALQREAAEIDAAASSRYRDLVEYYTVWVHQIKTPITSMKLSLEKEDTAAARKLSSDLFQIEQYVEMVLAYLRLDAEGSDYLFREQPLDGIVEQSLSRFAGEFIARGIRLNYTPTEEKVVTDEKWLSFVLEQLLSNALKYTRAGEIRIFLSEPKVLCIADTGIGIAASDLPRVFEKGYTGVNGRSDKRASGIGLYLCKKICESLGIDIRISSRLGEGTSVFLNLAQYKLKKE